MSIAAEFLELIAADPVAIARLRELVREESATEPALSAPAFTVQTLALELRRSERSIRAAIARGELHAVKRGRGYVIGSEAVSAWAQAEQTPRAPSRPGRRPSSRRSGSGPMARGVGLSRLS